MATILFTYPALRAKGRTEVELWAVDPLSPHAARLALRTVGYHEGVDGGWDDGPSPRK